MHLTIQALLLLLLLLPLLLLLLLLCNTRVCVGTSSNGRMPKHLRLDRF